MEIVFIVCGDTRHCRMAVEQVCGLPGIVPAGAFVVSHGPTRIDRLRWGLRTEGPVFLVLAALATLRRIAVAGVRRSGPARKDVNDLLHRAFPNRNFTLQAVADKFGFEVRRADHKHIGEIAAHIAGAAPDLAVVVGLDASRLSTAAGVPAVDVTSTPSASATDAGDTVTHEGHPPDTVTARLCTPDGDAFGLLSSSIARRATDTRASIIEKLAHERARVLGRAVEIVRDRLGSGQPLPTGCAQAADRHSDHSDARGVARMPARVRMARDVHTITRAVYALATYYSGLYSVVHALRCARRHSRAAILLYHRVNDYSSDPLTVDIEGFAAQLIAVSRRYPIVPTLEVVTKLFERRPIVPTTVAIHFDDCYRDVWTNGAPMLQAIHASATAFISTGFVGQIRTFDHDRKYPFSYDNLQAEHIRKWMEAGMEIGAHTVNHVDLARCRRDELEYEVSECARQLEAITGKSVALFSFPYGGSPNVSPTVIDAVKRAGYVAMFSAHGGIVDEETDPFDIPRMGADYSFAPLFLLLQIEGLAPNQIFRRITETLRCVRNLLRPSRR